MSLAFFQLDRRPKDFCVVVGLGLLGGAVARQLGYFNSTVFSTRGVIDWTDSASIIEQLDFTLRQYDIASLELIWAAGRAGFSATCAEMDSEFKVYKEVVSHLKNQYGAGLTINLLSSAGGIYEAAARVESIDDIAPLRPYAHSKLEQETLLQDEGFRYRIYRLSSVYGRGGSRMGLIQTLIKNTVMGRSLDIYADQNTLRDYVYNLDVGRQIASDIVSEVPNTTRIIATGRSTSIAMLLNLIQRITGRSPAASFRFDSSNTRDIVFAPHLFSSNLQSTSLEEGIRMIYKLTTSGNA